MELLLIPFLLDPPHNALPPTRSGRTSVYRGFKSGYEASRARISSRHITMIAQLFETYQSAS